MLLLLLTHLAQQLNVARMTTARRETSIFLRRAELSFRFSSLLNRDSSMTLTETITVHGASVLICSQANREAAGDFFVLLSSRPASHVEFESNCSNVGGRRNKARRRRLNHENSRQ